MNVSAFRQAVLRWFARHGRKHLPWQQTPTPYRVWLSEIMLQQTQVTTVISYFERFIQRFPTVFELAQASEDDVLHLWSGLGYYARARHLHKTAKIIVEEFKGEFPEDLIALQQLPGIGRSTAAAILAMAMHKKAAILDGNVKRVFARLFLISPWQNENALWTWAEKLAPRQHIAPYTQALMDLGSMICTRSRPKCEICPLTRYCLAFQQEKQTEFPGKKPKKALPVRQIHLLMLRDKKGRLLMEKRPSPGIWGGLWSLPEFSATSPLPAHCQQQLGCHIGAHRQLPAFRHTFTHFHLDITPIAITVPRVSPEKAAHRRWLTTTEQKKLGMPAPVRKLLTEKA